MISVSASQGMQSYLLKSINILLASDLRSQYMGSPSRRDGVALGETGDVFVFFAISGTYPTSPPLDLTHAVSSNVTATE